MSRVDHWATVRDRSVRPLQLPVLTDNGTEVAELKRALDEEKKVVKELVDEIASLYPGWAFTARNIAKAVAKLHGVTYLDMISQRRHKDVAWARQHAMWEMRHRTKLSTPQIGKILGGRDHTTVLHGIRAHEKRMKMGLV